MKIKKIFDKVKDKAGEILDGLLPQPQPQLVPIPVRNPSGNRAPRPKSSYRCNY